MKALDIETELRAWQLIQTLAESALAKFPTSLDQDLALLQDSSLTYNQRNCIKLRSQDKQILHFWINTASMIPDFAGLTQKQAINKLMKDLKKYKNIMHYIKKTLRPLLPKTEKIDKENKDELWI